jgi:hypothetical protein
MKEWHGLCFIFAETNIPGNTGIRPKFQLNGGQKWINMNAPADMYMTLPKATLKTA